MSSRFFLEPADVAPENARRVLDFLNAATTTSQIAEAVEFPDELDVGLRVAQRILDRRAQLGGFTSLQQVADIPLIGPERFTEIVTALSSQRVPGRPLTRLEQLHDEVSTLRQLLRSGAASSTFARRLTLRAAQPHAFLGQPMTIVATLLENGAPAVDVPITFVATRGKLRANDGYTAHHSHLITARSGLDGTVRLTLQATPMEEPTPLQWQALDAMLAQLDAAATTPRDLEKSFQLLAQQYAWEVNLPFRHAVDIFVRDFQPALLDTINPRDHLAEWTYHDSAVLAFVSADGGHDNGSAVSESATLHSRAKDWMPPFLEAFVALARTQNTLADELRELGRTETDTGKLVTAVYDRAGAYVASRWGRVGAYVGRKVAESSIRAFLDQELASLPLDARVEVFPALDVASKTLAAADVAVIRGLVGTRNDIAKEVDKKTRPTADLDGLFDRLRTLEVGVAALPSRADHERLRDELLAAVDTTHTELTTVMSGTRDELLAVMNTTRDELTASIDTSRTQLTTALDQTRTSLLSTLERATRDLDTRVTRLRTDVDQMLPRVNASVTTTELNAALTGRVTQAELAEAVAGRVTRAELNTALARKLDSAAFTTFSRDLDRRFLTLDDRINRLRPPG